MISSSYFGTLDYTSLDISVVLGVSLLIAVACATVIYSLFYVSVAGKIKEYGRLRVIGITQKQVRRMVRKESWKLSLLSIPAGLVLGSLIGFAIVPKGWYWPNTLKCAVAIALVTELAVRISIRKPVKIASSVSPIEAVREATTTAETAIEKTGKLSRKITPAVRAKINFARNHKKVALTLASSGFTGIFLMCASTILTSADPVDIARQNFLGGYEMKTTCSRYYHLDFQVVLTPPPEHPGYLLNPLGKRVQSGKAFHDGDLVSSPYEDCDIRLKKVREIGRDVLRLLIPDKYNRFPEEPDCLEPYKYQELPMFEE